MDNANDAVSAPCSSIANSTIGARGLTSGQLSYDRSERFGEGGADDDIREADLLPAPLDFLGEGRRIIRKDGKRVHRSKRSRVGVGRRHERRDRVAYDGHVECELNVAR